VGILNTFLVICAQYLKIFAYRSVKSADLSGKQLKKHFNQTLAVFLTVYMFMV